MSSGVRLRGVTRRFGDVVAVDSVDLDIEQGELVALLGPSGCGKTTTLRLIAGFEAPDAGDVRIGEQDAAGPGRWVAPERRRVGMVFQQLALFPHLDVAANVAYGLRGTKGAKAARVEALLDLVGLQGYGGRYPDELSGGQAQRVALARALAPEPDVVLLDEPFSSLDVSLRADVRREVRTILAAAGATALLVTHDQDEALAFGDRVAVMLAGRLAQMGSPEEVYRRPATPAVAEFLGDANLLPGEVRAGRLETVLGSLPLVAGAERDGPAWGLVRPEDLDLEEASEGEATVADVEYYGHDQLVTVALESGTLLRARLHARRRFPEGSTVRLRVGGLGIVAFPAADGG